MARLSYLQFPTREEMTRNMKNFPKEKVELKSLDVLFLRHKFSSGKTPEDFHKQAREFAFHLQNLGVFVINNPVYLPYFSSKLSYLGIGPNILPSKQFVSSNFEELYSFCNKILNYNGVIKSLYGYGSEDVYLIEKKNLKNTLRALLKKGPVLAQDYIPNKGDKRILILLLNGEPIGWYKRVAQVGENLHNIHLGGRPISCDLSENDTRIIKLLRPFLVKYGIVFVGIDILGNTLSEINSEVPGGTVRADKLGGFQARERIVQYLERKVSQK